MTPTVTATTHHYLVAFEMKLSDNQLRLCEAGGGGLEVMLMVIGWELMDANLRPTTLYGLVAFNCMLPQWYREVWESDGHTLEVERTLGGRELRGNGLPQHQLQHITTPCRIEFDAGLRVNSTVGIGYKWFGGCADAGSMGIDGVDSSHSLGRLQLGTTACRIRFEDMLCSG